MAGGRVRGQHKCGKGMSNAALLLLRCPKARQSNPDYFNKSWDCGGQCVGLYHGDNTVKLCKYIWI